MELELHAGAQEDLREAVEWYAERDEDVARAFLSAVDSVLRGLQSYPGRWPVHPKLGLRRITLRRFPYSILYELIDRRVLVFAVAHNKRRPEYWHDRRDELL